MQKKVEQELQEYYYYSSFDSRVSRVKEQGLDFLLSHFSDPLFPRTISRTAVNKRQYEIASADEAMMYYRAALLEDLRINGFYVGQRNPDLLFLDVDEDNEQNTKLSLTLKNIDRILGGQPTIIKSGGHDRSYHVIQPLKAPKALEGMSEYVELARAARVPVYDEKNDLSNDFMQFSERLLSGGRSDPAHHAALRSCLLRVPYSKNSKTGSEVTILQAWDGYRPHYGKLTMLYHEHLRSEKNKIESRERRKKANVEDEKNKKGTADYKIEWIEKLLQTPLDDFRKLAVDLILAPYLVVDRGLDYDTAYDILMQWLSLCHRVDPLNFPAERRVDEKLKRAEMKEIPHMSLNTLRQKYSDLYRRIVAGQ